MKNDKRYFQIWRRGNKQMLNAMFSGKLLKIWTKKDVEQYFDQIVKIYEELPGRYLIDHSTLQNTIGNYFDIMDWNVGFEISFEDIDSSYIFDIVAQKGAKRIVVEVKPEITTRDLGQILGYLFDVKKKFKKVVMFLGTDIWNLDVIFGGGEIRDIIIDNAKHGLGIILADEERAWLIPPEFLLI